MLLFFFIKKKKKKEVFSFVILYHSRVDLNEMREIIIEKREMLEANKLFMFDSYFLTNLIDQPLDL
jgi:hypothetical protein